MGANNDIYYYLQPMSGLQEWILPPLPQSLQTIMTQLHAVLKGGLDEQRDGDQEEVKGLKFISNKLIRLFERNRRLKYTHISKILIDNFSSESNDSRNIKRRVYDAINVMVAAGLFTKNGDNLEKRESLAFRQRVESIKHEIGGNFKQKQILVNNKKLMANRLNKRILKIQQLQDRNRMAKGLKEQEKIMNPMVVNLKDGTRRVQIKGIEQQVCRMDLGRSSKSRHKGAVGTKVLRDLQYLQYL